MTMQTSCCLVSALLLALVLARNAQNVDFSFNSNFATRMLLDGNCTVKDDGLLRLSVNSSDPNLGSARGLASRAVYAEPVQLYDAASGAAASFNTSFVFGVKAVPGNFMGDGMTFLIAPTRSVPLHSGGGSLGLYDTSVYPSGGDPQIQVVAVEWDTFQDSSQDIDSNHVGLDINSGVSVKAQSLSQFGFQLNASQNLQRFQVWIEYDAGLEQILVYMADWRPEAPIAKLDAALVLTYTGLNLSSVIRNMSYVGFTATTGFYIQENIIYSWSFSSRGLPPAAAPTPLPVPEAVTPPPPEKSGSSDVGLVAGIVSGVVAFLAVVAGVAVCCCCFKRGRNERSNMEPALLLATGTSPGWKASGDGSGGGNPIPSGGSSFSSQKKGFSSSGASSGSSWTDLYSPSVNYGPRPYSYQELKDAAGGFTKADVLGRGGFGHVYRGVIRNADGSEMIVAIKKTAQNSMQGEREFRAEVLSIGRLRHKNLVHLLGWCHEDGELLLVYEFMTNSSLDRHLYSPHGQVQLPWDQRLRIVQGVAAALVYIHTEAPEKCILHRDLKPSNVMLDSRMTARLGDFGLARIVEDTTFTAGVSLTHLAGTSGYMAPELAMAAKATTKSDMFSFGVLALEVASGRKPYLPIHEDQPDVRLLDWVWQMHEAGKLLEVGDPALEGNLDEGQLQRVLHVGLLCTHPDPGLRPETRRVQQMLQEDAALPQLPPSRPVAFYK